jgi:hypothetical protein
MFWRRGSVFSPVLPAVLRVIHQGQGSGRVESRIDLPSLRETWSSTTVATMTSACAPAGPRRMASRVGRTAPCMEVLDEGEAEHLGVVPDQTIRLLGQADRDRCPRLLAALRCGALTAATRCLPDQ